MATTTAKTTAKANTREASSSPSSSSPSSTLPPPPRKTSAERKSGKLPTVAEGRFEVVRKLGQGAFSRVYEAYDTMGKRPCALKVDQSGSKLKEPLVDYESRVMHELQGIVGVPDLLWTGDVTPPNRTPPLRCMALELLGADLEEHRKGSKLTLKNATCLGYVILNVLKDIHARGFLHRDLKPSNHR